MTASTGNSVRRLFRRLSELSVSSTPSKEEGRTRWTMLRSRFRAARESRSRRAPGSRSLEFRR